MSFVHLARLSLKCSTIAIGQSVKCARSNIIRHNYPVRSFSVSHVQLKAKKDKTSKGKTSKNAAAEEEEEVIFDSKSFLTQLEKDFKESLEAHKVKSNETKKTNVHMFDNLKVHLSHGKVEKFTNIAHTTVKGRNLLITVFDPSDSKNIVSAVLGANLNLNPQIDPKNPQFLKVPLPSPTKEVKEQVSKQLKQVYNDFKSSGKKNSLSIIRQNAMKELKSIKGDNNTVKSVSNQVEALFKKYSNSLTEQYKSLEKMILN